MPGPRHLSGIGNLALSGCLAGPVSGAPNLVLTNDHAARNVVRVPTDPLPEWVLQQRRHIGQQVRALREGRGWSQEHLAELAMLDRKTIYRIELATYGTRIDHLVLVARALGVPPGSLFG